MKYYNKGTVGFTGIDLVEHLLGDDLVFFEDGHIVYDGHNHHVKSASIQMPSNSWSEFDSKLMDVLANNLIDCMNFVEQNETLRRKKEDITDQSVKNFLDGNDLTGSILIDISTCFAKICSVGK